MRIVFRWVMWKLFGTYRDRWGQGNHMVATDDVVYGCRNGHYANGYLQYHTYDSVTDKETPLLVKSCHQCGSEVAIQNSTGVENA